MIEEHLKRAHDPGSSEVFDFAIKDNALRGDNLKVNRFGHVLFFI